MISVTFLESISSMYFRYSINSSSNVISLSIMRAVSEFRFITFLSSNSEFLIDASC